jgi:hypothetical protein
MQHFGAVQDVYFVQLFSALKSDNESVG